MLSFVLFVLSMYIFYFLLRTGEDMKPVEILQLGTKGTFGPSDYKIGSNAYCIL